MVEVFFCFLAAYAIRYANTSRPQTVWFQAKEGFNSVGTEKKSKRVCLQRKIALNGEPVGNVVKICGQKEQLLTKLSETLLPKKQYLIV